MKKSFVLCYACLIKPSPRPHLPPRLKELAELMPQSPRTVADIGTDHGLLAFALAAQRPHTQVIGVDASRTALKQGAETLPKLPNLEFCHGNGLDGLNGYSSVEGACIAGMGVNTMVEILRPNKLDDMDCRNLVLQPTGSRPRQLASLYEHLAIAQWYLTTESMCFNSKRWYLTSLWQRNETISKAPSIPGICLEADDLVGEWAAHHCNWIRSDHSAGRTPTTSEKQWMELFC